MHRALRASIVIIAVLVFGWLVSAQSAPTVYVGQSFDIFMAHDGLRTNTYHLAITGPTAYQADLSVSALAAGKITFPIPSGFSATGNYSAVVTAIGDGGSTPSDPFVFVVQSLPAPPAKGTVGMIKH